MYGIKNFLYFCLMLAMEQKTGLSSSVVSSPKIYFTNGVSQISASPGALAGRQECGFLERYGKRLNIWKR
jgi:hypothetical protein